MKQRKYKRHLYGRIQTDAIAYYKNYDWEAFRQVVMDRSKHTKRMLVILDAEFADSQPEHKKWRRLATESLKLHRRLMFRKRRPRLNLAYGGQHSIAPIPNPYLDRVGRGERLVTMAKITDFNPEKAKVIHAVDPASMIGVRGSIDQDGELTIDSFNLIQ